MFRSIRASLCLAAAVVGCAIPQFAKADTISAVLTGLDPYTFGSVYLQGAGTLNGGVGNLIWSGNANNSAPFNGTFNTYCIDLIQDIGFGGGYSFTVVPLQSAPKAGAYPSGSPTTGMGQMKANEISEMYAQHYGDTLGNTSTAAFNREGFQLAIWNILYDTDASVSTGSGVFYATSNIDSHAINAANGFLTDALNTANQSVFHATDLVGLIGNDGAQDQIAIDPFIPITSGAPLPSSVLGGSVLLVGLAVARSRRQNLLLNAM